MLPFHPIFASFPAVLLFVIFITELVAFFGDTNTWRVFSCYLACLLGIFSIATYYTGFYDAERANITFQVPEEVISHHQASAKLFLMSLIPTILFSIIRAIKPNEILHWVYTPCLVLSLILACLTSHRGGELVFKHGASVDVLPTTQTAQPVAVDTPEETISETVPETTETKVDPKSKKYKK